MNSLSFAETIKNTFRCIYLRIPDEIRFGKIYRKQRQFLRNTIKCSREEIDLWQMEKIKEIVRNAYEESNYYKKLLDNIGMKPDDLQTISDFKKIPSITKEMIQNNLGKIIYKRYNKSQLNYVTTGGSTGIPLGLYYIRGFSKSIEWAFVHDIWSKFGFETNKKHVILRGNVIEKSVVRKRVLELILSSYHLTEGNMSKYIKSIYEFKPEYIQAYPSSISMLCQYMKENSLPPFQSLKMVMCSSENLFSFQKDMIYDVLKVPICNLYGNTEHTCIASNCRFSDYLHFRPEYGFVEILNEMGEECAVEGDIGEIVATSFNNPAFPLIRYKTGDIAIYTNKKCKCGWNYKLIKEIQGREQEFIITNTGRKICIAAINMHSDIFDHIYQFQFYQNYPGKVTFKFIPKENCSIMDERKIYSEIIKKLGDDVQLNLKRVDKMEVSQRGKHKFLIQELKVNQYCNGI